MKMMFKGVEETFRAALGQQQKITQEEMRRRLASMLVMLEASTPVLTGFARSRWKIDGSYPRFRVLNDASYIEYLNAGSSKQAPMFFVESVALRFGKPYGVIASVVPSSPGS